MRRALVHGGLLLATFASMTGAFWKQQPPDDPYALQDSLLFAACSLLILGAHEMGHYLMARAWSVDSSLPYFIPLPLPFGFGTMGAVIQLKGKIPSRNALFDIGAGGPLAGLAIAIPLLVAGVMASSLSQTPAVPFPPSFSLLSFASEAGLALRHWLDGVSPPEPTGFQATLFGDNVLTLLVTRLVWGRLPPGVDVLAHPVFMAAWFGLLVTMFNLLPVGQLDGGHVMRAFFGPRAEKLGPHVASALLILALLCSVSWLIWFGLVLRVIGFGHPPPVDDETPLSVGRKVASVGVWVLTVLCFIPVPLDVVTLP